MKKLAAIGIIIMSLFTSCDDNDDCPQDMQKCKLNNGTEICVPKGKC